MQYLSAIIASSLGDAEVSRWRVTEPSSKSELQLDVPMTEKLQEATSSQVTGFSDYVILCDDFIFSFYSDISNVMQGKTQPLKN